MFKQVPDGICYQLWNHKTEFFGSYEQMVITLLENNITLESFNWFKQQGEGFFVFSSDSHKYRVYVSDWRQLKEDVGKYPLRDKFIKQILGLPKELNTQNLIDIVRDDFRRDLRIAIQKRKSINA